MQAAIQIAVTRLHGDGEGRALPDGGIGFLSKQNRSSRGAKRRKQTGIIAAFFRSLETATGAMAGATERSTPPA
jgi:hypothetical protein